MKIIISGLTNCKLLDNFPNDPYYDITIKTQTMKFNLSLAYLSIDSQYFQQLHHQIKIVDLSVLPERQLTLVLRALYGDELNASSVDELSNLYEVINYLKIDSFKNNIIEAIINTEQLLSCIQILLFCIKFNICVQKIKQYHVNNNLKVLTDTKNYFYFNKIPADILNQLLLEHYNQYGLENEDTINQILQNYFCRSNINAVDYFTTHNVPVLILIWQKHHHTLQFFKKKSSKLSISPCKIDNQSSNGEISPTKSIKYSITGTPQTQSHRSRSDSQNLFGRIQLLKKSIILPQDDANKMHYRTYSFNQTIAKNLETHLSGSQEIKQNTMKKRSKMFNETQNFKFTQNQIEQDPAEIETLQRENQLLMKRRRK